MTPILLSPVGRESLWGGTRLRTEYGKNIESTPLAETWECSTHPHGLSTVANGEFAGKTLLEVLTQHPEFLGCHVPKGDGLPILVKFIDAKKDLSIQVHPDDEYALANEQAKGKTEMWFVVDAVPGAKLIHGFAHRMTKEQVLNAAVGGSLVSHLQQVEVHKGDVFFNPAGTIHGIGAGCLIVEIQQNSDITYRVYDYDRLDQNGQKRELHFNKALEVLNLDSGKELRQNPRQVRSYPGYSREVLCRCKYFTTERIVVKQAVIFNVRESTFQVILCLEGGAELRTTNCGEPLHLKKGDCVFLPAGLGRCRVLGECEFLKIRV